MPTCGGMLGSSSAARHRRGHSDRRGRGRARRGMELSLTLRGDSNPCFRRLIQRLGAATRGGDLTVATLRPGVSFLRCELGQFLLKTGMSGWVRLEAARGHDDLVIATALAVLAA